MSNDITKKQESQLNKKLIEKANRGKIFDGFEKNKVINEVLDKTTMLTLFDMINSHFVSYVNGVVRAGKESVLFWAVNEKDEDIALKVYLVTTSNFKRRSSYILGDPRFSRIKKGTRNLVYLWAKKEFMNLSKCFDKGLPVPKPIHITKNVLTMKFIGDNGVPCKTLLESEIDENDYHDAISLIRRLYQEVELVHGDFSEYNIFKTKNGLMIFDLGSAVDLKHPNSEEFLKRDINNITNFFVKRGLVVENPIDVLEKVIS